MGQSGGLTPSPTLNNEQMQRLDDLSQILAENECLLSEREALLQTLKVQLADLSETYRCNHNYQRNTSAIKSALCGQRLIESVGGRLRW
jgi:hypothetical protein